MTITDTAKKVAPLLFCGIEREVAAVFDADGYGHKGGGSFFAGMYKPGVGLSAMSTGQVRERRKLMPSLPLLRKRSYT